MNYIGILVSSISLSITGNAIWILSLVNLAWLLFKDYTLFSWWWPIGCAIAFGVSFIIWAVSISKNQ